MTNENLGVRSLAGIPPAHIPSAGVQQHQRAVAHCFDSKGEVLLARSGGSTPDTFNPYGTDLESVSAFPLIIAVLIQLAEAVLLPKLPPILHPGGSLPSPLAIPAAQATPGLMSQLEPTHTSFVEPYPALALMIALPGVVVVVFARRLSSRRRC